MKLRKEITGPRIVVNPENTFVFTYTDKEGNTQELLKTEAGRSFVIDKVLLFDVENEFGLKTGIAGMVGESDGTKA